LEKHIKGMDLMLDAIKRSESFLRANNATVDLYGPDMLGRGDDIRNMIAERKIGDIVTLHDAITGSDKENRLLEADIFIQTSRTEGMPMGIVEAIAYGLPCLVTKGTNVGEMIEKNNVGWVAETDSISISEKLELVIAERDQWMEKSQQARAFVTENFLWEKVSFLAVEKYKDLSKMDKECDL
jgi:glycosyltransferase involved in cell wall biosynthesis